LKRLPAIDPDNLYPSGRVGLISASQSSPTVPGDATFDNFLATTDEPRLTVNKIGNAVSVSWPNIPYRLQTTSTLSPPNWTDVTTGIVHTPLENTYSVAPTGAGYFRLIWP
jgi:hypothetical protein